MRTRRAASCPVSSALVVDSLVSSVVAVGRNGRALYLEELALIGAGTLLLAIILGTASKLVAGLELRLWTTGVFLLSFALVLLWSVKLT